MRAPLILTLSFGLIAACGSNAGNGTASPGDDRARSSSAARAPEPATPADRANSGKSDRSTAMPSDGSILAWSRPAAGATVNAPVNDLVLHFSPPARLGEVTVTGPEGTMPMMVSAVGEVEHYSLPLSGLGAGSYTVAWKAGASGVDYRGSLGFEVK